MYRYKGKQLKFGVKMFLKLEDRDVCDGKVKLVLEEAVGMGWGGECLGNCRRANRSNQNGS